MAEGTRRKQRFGVPQPPRVVSPPSAQAPTLIPIARGPRGADVPISLTGQPTEIPEAWARQYPKGTLIEYLVWWALTQLGYVPFRDFSYQKAALTDGAPLSDLPAGSTVIDFLVFRDAPPIAIYPEGRYWHVQNPVQLAKDIAKYQAIRAGYGYDVIPLDEQAVLLNAKYVVGWALKRVIVSDIYRGKV